MKPRSPVLGYNHNVRYVARMWHVQTEDSGVQAPHIFTHLFCDGTILASKKTDYDAASEVSLVQKLMQTQHKAMLRELKSGAFDDKIEKYFGPIVREPEVAVSEAAVEAPDVHTAITAGSLEAMPDESAPNVPPPRSREDEHPTVPDLAQLMPPPAAHPPTQRGTEAPRARASLTPARPSIAVTARSGAAPTPPVAARPAAARPPTIGGRSAPPTLRSSAPPTIGSSRGGASSQKPGSGGVVVARPTVIVGGEPQRGAADFWKTERRAPPDPAFGGDLISEKSLDEVILAYLSEDAPKK